MTRKDLDPMGDVWLDAMVRAAYERPIPAKPAPLAFHPDAFALAFPDERPPAAPDATTPETARPGDMAEARRPPRP